MSENVLKKESEIVLRHCSKCGGEEKKEVPFEAKYFLIIGTIWRKMNCKHCNNFNQEVVSSKEEIEIIKNFTLF